MTGPSVPVTEPGPPPREVGREIGRAAALIGAITVLARVIGFGRQLVFAHTVGSTCLGTAYATANQVPNIVYDIVLGGALTSVVVPVLAAPAARRGAGMPAAQAAAAGHPGSPAGEAGADAEASDTASALLSWTVVLLVPVSVVIAVTARPVAELLLAGGSGCGQEAITGVSSRMLAVFAPQILLYGLAVVLYGILQAHRRFAAPALAPVLSSMVVIAAYAAFVPLGGKFADRLWDLPRSAELMLSVGTTAGVAALVVTVLGPALRLRLRLRPMLRFPPGVARRVRSLAVVGLAVLAAQDAALVAVIVLANGRGGQGALVLYNYGWQVFFVPYAVLALPVATTAFPVLSASGGPDFDRTAASSTRAVMLVSWLGVALLAGAARPAARLFVARPGQVHQLAIAFAVFALGLVGYGLAASLSRVLFASGRDRVAAAALIGGWLVTITVDVAAVPFVRSHWVVPVLAMGNTVGLTCAGAGLLAAVHAVKGPAVLRGSARAAGAGLAGAAAGAGLGTLVSAWLPVSGFFPNAGVTVLAAAAAVAAFGACALMLDQGDLRAVAGRLVRRRFR